MSSLAPRTLVLEGSPTCTLHVPSGEKYRWIGDAIQARSADIRQAVDRLCIGLAVTALETHGPGISLPAEYGARSPGNVAAHAGVTVHFAEGEPFRLTELYSTMGGPSPLMECESSNAATILLSAIRKAGAQLQSSLR